MAGDSGEPSSFVALIRYLRDGELVNAKYRNAAEKRDMRQEGGAEPCLFGWHLIDPKARRIAIAEGEIDAMTLHQCDIPALSVNAGAGNHQWLENDWSRLERFSEILICYDNDEAGEKGAREVMHRLGIERCKRVIFPAKDANDYLLQGADGSDFDEAIRSAKTQDPEELRQASDFMDRVKAMFYLTRKGEKSPLVVAKAVTMFWLDDRCQYCWGVGSFVIPGTPILGTTCRHCGGTGQRPIPFGEVGKATLAHMDAAAESALHSMRRRLRNTR
ncbi:MAG: toprim domain-containing protein [Ottowia sp.]|uniref:toprim domain-containing protein n=1 Tax=Ottowia sp. TaxID=1898956 RepID=UPI0039E68EDE